MYIVVLAVAAIVGSLLGTSLQSLFESPLVIAVVIGMVLLFGVMLPNASASDKSSNLMIGAVKTLLWQFGLYAIGFGSFVVKLLGIARDNPEVAIFLVNFVGAILLGGIPYWIKLQSNS
jgi:hypothetical protein